MAQTRMFRDRVVSMEQTLEGGEKHLPLLQLICREAFPDFSFRESSLDHERDLFVMELDRPNGQKKRVCWTRMVLFDAERIPTLTGDPASTLRMKIVEYLRARSSRSEIVVTFRHLEDGWVDSPETRREGRRRRRGGRGGRGPERSSSDRRPSGAPEVRPGGEPKSRPAVHLGRMPPSGGPTAPRPAEAAGEGGALGTGSSAAKRRRRLRRRRRGGRTGGPGGVLPPS
ncbi:MAG TPA: hypothetical protein VGL03_11245 [Thermoanaerobaculia bacterium]